METIGRQKIWSFVDDARQIGPMTCTQIRTSRGYKVDSFIDLARKVAELQFMNLGFVLLFRGQDADHRNAKHNTTLKPSLFRSKHKGNPSSEILIRRFQDLENAERLLVDSFPQNESIAFERLKRNQTIRWSILQHYKICPTPLLDVTQSLRIAASFASDKADSEAFIFVLGVPNLSGAISASADAGLQIIRLSSVCPPSALRPHIQEGYLLGEYPEMAGYAQKELYHHYEIDFGRRLVAKFRFDPRTFWGLDAFPKVERGALYPGSNLDPLYRMTLKIRKNLTLGD
jgi:hypothetical protein